MSSQTSPIMRQPSHVVPSTGAEGLPQEKSYLASKPVKCLSIIGDLRTEAIVNNDEEAPGNAFGAYAI